MADGGHAEDVTTGRAALAGTVAAASALAVGELVGALGDPPLSLTAGVGTAFVDRFAASLKDVAVSLFGTNDKAALVVGIMAVCLGAGAVLGVAARRRPAMAIGGFVAFGALGVLAASTDPGSRPLLAVVAAAAAVTTGLVVLRALLRAAGARPPVGGRTDTPTDPAAPRRSFLGWSAAVGAGAVAVAGIGRALAGRSAAEAARRSITLPPPADPLPRAVGSSFGVEGLTPYIVANDAFYRIDTALVVPQVDPTDWSLRITGMVDRPLTLSYTDLLALAQVEETVTIQCVSNEVGGDLVGNARWQGVRLTDVLDRAGVQPGATQVVGRSVDGWTAGFPTDVVRDGRTALIALGMNGEPLPVVHGFPARLIVAGLYGYVSATKWLREIELTTWDAFDGYWVPRGWSKSGPIKVASRIDVPRDGALGAGPTTIAGVAWAPPAGIERVEVQVDDGPWLTARLGDRDSDSTWVQWVLPWTATPGEHRLRVRATDRAGTVQTSAVAPPAPDGATGLHTRVVQVR